MKKLLSVIFAVCLAVCSVMVIAACGENGADTQAGAPITFSYSIVKDGDETYYSLKNVTVSDKAQALIAKKDFAGLADLFNTDAGEYKAPAVKYTKDTVTTLVIPEEYNKIAVKAISQDAVSGLAFVKKIVVGDNITKMSEGAFSSLIALEEIELPFVGGEKNAKNEKKLFGYIFGTTSGDGLTSCEQKYNGGDSGNTKTYYLPSALKTITVRGGNEKKDETLKFKIEEKDGEIKYVYEGEDGYDELDAVENSATENTDVYSVAPYSFYNCTTLETINLSGVEEIEEYTFYGCTGIKNLTFGDDVKTIGAHAYENCTSLKAVDFNNVETIGESAFAGCTALGEKYLDGANKIVFTDIEIGNSAFSGCTAIKDVEFNGECEIGERAFKGCTAIETVDFTNVTSVGDYAFYGCTNLASITNYDGSISDNHIFEETEYVKHLK